MTCTRNVYLLSAIGCNIDLLRIIDRHWRRVTSQIAHCSQRPLKGTLIPISHHCGVFDGVNIIGIGRIPIAVPSVVRKTVISSGSLLHPFRRITTHSLISVLLQVARTRSAVMARKQ